MSKNFERTPVSGVIDPHNRCFGLKLKFEKVQAVHRVSQKNKINIAFVQTIPDGSKDRRGTGRFWPQ
jgi:hypothetical protein